MAKATIYRRRPKGSGKLVARYGYWAMRWIANGRQVQETTRFRVDVKADRAKALALLDERTEIWRLKNEQTRLQVLIAQAESIEAKIRKLQEIGNMKQAVTLGELVELWRKSPRRRDCGAAQEAALAAKIAAFVEWAGEGMDIRAVDDGVAERYARQLAAKSGGTYNKHLNALDAAWKAVGRSAGVEGNPWAELPRRRQEAHRRRNLTPQEIDAILGAAEGEWRALIEIGLHTGLRLGDACRLKWEAFKADGAVEVKTAKTGAVVRLPAAALLSELRNVTGGHKTDIENAKTPIKAGGDNVRSGHVMPGMAAAYGRDSSAVSKRVTDLFTRAGIATREKRKGWLQSRPTASFHSLRHTFVTRCVEAGVPVAVVRELVGHTRETMTEHYSHISAEAMEAALSALAK